MLRRNVLAAVAAPTLVACASKKPTVPFYRIDVNDYAGTVYLPPLLETSSVNIGERMIATRRVAVVPRIVIPSDLDVEEPYDSKWRLVTKLRAGVYSLVATDKAGGNYFRPALALSTYYKSLDKAKEDTEGTKHWGGVFISPTGEAFLYVLWDGYSEPSSFVALPRLSTTAGTTELDLPGEHLQKELLYLGLSQSTITLRYREYWRGVARPDFSLEVRYDLSQGRSIGYRESRFEVLDVNNTTITYRTTAHLK